MLPSGHDMVVENMNAYKAAIVNLHKTGSINTLPPQFLESLIEPGACCFSGSQHPYAAILYYSSLHCGDPQP